MTVFYSIAALLTLLAIAWIVRPLLRAAPQGGVSSQRLNAAIYRDQLQILERDLSRGSISASDYEATQDELQLRLLDDTEETKSSVLQKPAPFWTPRRTSATLALLIPLGAAGLYKTLGQPEAIDPVAAQQVTNEKVAHMVDSLAARLKANPDDLQGWAMLARSYKVMGRLDEAEQAFIKAGDKINTDANLLVDYADLLAARADSKLEGRPLELINKALALNPQHPMGLMLSGVAAFARADFSGAEAQWKKLLPLLDPESPDAQQVEAYIAEAQEKAGTRPTPKAVGQSESGKLPPVSEAAAAGGMTAEKINQMVDRLAERLKSNPDDLAGWARLARAYKVQGRLPEAVQAYAKAGKLVEADPDLLTQYADVLGMRAGNNLEGRPLALVKKALALNPKHPVALMMAGSAAFRRADYAQAIAHWENVLTVLPPGSSDAAQVRTEIAEARAKGGTGAK